MIRHLHDDLDLALLEAFHRTVLTPSFSKDELEPYEDLARGLRGQRDGDTLVSVAVDDHGEPLGGMVGERFPGSDVLLISYVAVHPGRRGGGIGSRLVNEVLPTWTAEIAAPLAVGEVHDPRAWPGGADEDPVARMRFYERLGVKVLEMAFVQPALEPGGTRVPGFLLLAFHADPAITSRRDGRDYVPAALVADFVASYYAAAEGPVAFDAEVRAVLDPLRERSGVALIDVRDWHLVPLPGGGAERRPPGGP